MALIPIRLKWKINLGISSFKNTLCLLFALIRQPITKKEKSKILIDNIFFNSFEITSVSNNMNYSIPDHSIQSVILENFIEPSSPCRSNTYKKIFTKIDSNELKENFNKTDWDKIICENGKNLNGALNSFYNSHENF